VKSLGYNPSEATTPITVMEVKAVFNMLYIRCKQPDGTFRAYNILAGELPQAVPGSGNIGFEYGDIEAATPTSVSYLFIDVVDDTGRAIITWAVRDAAVVRSQSYYFDMPNRDYGLSIIIGHDTTEDDRRDFTISAITVPLIDTALTISAPAEVYVNETFSITGRLTRVDTGEGIPDQTVELSYNDTSIGSVTTGSDGSYSATASIPTAGTYTLKAYYPGTATYSSSMATTSVGVSRAKVTGPLGFWWFPILVRLAEVFPWARNLLDKLTAK